MDRTLLEVCWRVRGRSGCIFTCSSYREELGHVELRVEHHEEGTGSVVFSLPVASIDVARKVAALWREAILNNYFVEVLH